MDKRQPPRTTRLTSDKGNPATGRKVSSATPRVKLQDRKYTTAARPGASSQCNRQSASERTTVKPDQRKESTGRPSVGGKVSEVRWSAPKKSSIKPNCQRTTEVRPGSSRPLRSSLKASSVKVASEKQSIKMEPRDGVSDHNQEPETFCTCTKGVDLDHAGLAQHQSASVQSKLSSVQPKVSTVQAKLSSVQINPLLIQSTSTDSPESSLYSKPSMVQSSGQSKLIDSPDLSSSYSKPSYIQSGAMLHSKPTDCLNQSSLYSKPSTVQSSGQSKLIDSPDQSSVYSKPSSVQNSSMLMQSSPTDCHNQSSVYSKPSSIQGSAMLMQSKSTDCPNQSSLYSKPSSVQTSGMSVHSKSADSPNQSYIQSKLSSVQSNNPMLMPSKLTVSSKQPSVNSKRSVQSKRTSSYFVDADFLQPSESPERKTPRRSLSAGGKYKTIDLPVDQSFPDIEMDFKSSSECPPQMQYEPCSCQEVILDTVSSFMSDDVICQKDVPSTSYGNNVSYESPLSSNSTQRESSITKETYCCKPLSKDAGEDFICSSENERGSLKRIAEEKFESLLKYMQQSSLSKNSRSSERYMQNTAVSENQDDASVQFSEADSAEISRDFHKRSLAMEYDDLGDKENNRRRRMSCENISEAIDGIARNISILEDDKGNQNSAGFSYSVDLKPSKSYIDNRCNHDYNVQNTNDSFDRTINKSQETKSNYSLITFNDKHHEKSNFCLRHESNDSLCKKDDHFTFTEENKYSVDKCPQKVIKPQIYEQIATVSTLPDCCDFGTIEDVSDNSWEMKESETTISDCCNKITVLSEEIKPPNDAGSTFCKNEAYSYSPSSRMLKNTAEDSNVKIKCSEKTCNSVTEENSGTRKSSAWLHFSTMEKYKTIDEHKNNADYGKLNLTEADGLIYIDNPDFGQESNLKLKKQRLTDSTGESFSTCNQLCRKCEDVDDNCCTEPANYKWNNVDTCLPKDSNFLTQCSKQDFNENQDLHSCCNKKNILNEKRENSPKPRQMDSSSKRDLWLPESSGELASVLRFPCHESSPSVNHPRDEIFLLSEENEIAESQPSLSKFENSTILVMGCPKSKHSDIIGDIGVNAHAKHRISDLPGNTRETCINSKFCEFKPSMEKNKSKIVEFSEKIIICSNMDSDCKMIEKDILESYQNPSSEDQLCDDSGDTITQLSEEIGLNEMPSPPCLTSVLKDKKSQVYSNLNEEDCRCPKMAKISDCFSQIDHASACISKEKSCLKRHFDESEPAKPSTKRIKFVFDDESRSTVDDNMDSLKNINYCQSGLLLFSESEPSDPCTYSMQKLNFKECSKDFDEICHQSGYKNASCENENGQITTLSEINDTTDMECIKFETHEKSDIVAAEDSKVLSNYKTGDCSENIYTKYNPYHGNALSGNLKKQAESKNCNVIKRDSVSKSYSDGGDTVNLSIIGKRKKTPPHLRSSLKSSTPSRSAGQKKFFSKSCSDISNDLKKGEKEFPSLKEGCIFSNALAQNVTLLSEENGKLAFTDRSKSRSGSLKSRKEYKVNRNSAGKDNLDGYVSDDYFDCKEEFCCNHTEGDTKTSEIFFDPDIGTDMMKSKRPCQMVNFENCKNSGNGCLLFSEVVSNSQKNDDCESSNNRCCTNINVSNENYTGNSDNIQTGYFRTMPHGSNFSEEIKKNQKKGNLKYLESIKQSCDTNDRSAEFGDNFCQHNENATEEDCSTLRMCQLLSEEDEHNISNRPIAPNKKISSAKEPVKQHLNFIRGSDTGGRKHLPINVDGACEPDKCGLRSRDVENDLSDDQVSCKNIYQIYNTCNTNEKWQQQSTSFSECDDIKSPSGGENLTCCNDNGQESKKLCTPYKDKTVDEISSKEQEDSIILDDNHCDGCDSCYCDCNEHIDIPIGKLATGFTNKDRCSNKIIPTNQDFLQTNESNSSNSDQLFKVNDRGRYPEGKSNPPSNNNCNKLNKNSRKPDSREKCGRNAVACAHESSSINYISGQSESESDMNDYDDISRLVPSFSEEENCLNDDSSSVVIRRSVISNSPRGDKTHSVNFQKINSSSRQSFKRPNRNIPPSDGMIDLAANSYNNQKCSFKEENSCNNIRHGNESCEWKFKTSNTTDSMCRSENFNQVDKHHGILKFDSCYANQSKEIESYFSEEDTSFECKPCEDRVQNTNNINKTTFSQCRENANQKVNSLSKGHIESLSLFERTCLLKKEYCFSSTAKVFHMKKGSESPDEKQIPNETTDIVAHNENSGISFSEEISSEKDLCQNENIDVNNNQPDLRCQENCKENLRDGEYSKKTFNELMDEKKKFVIDSIKCGGNSKCDDPNTESNLHCEENCKENIRDCEYSKKPFHELMDEKKKFVIDSIKCGGKSKCVDPSYSVKDSCEIEKNAWPCQSNQCQTSDSTLAADEVSIFSEEYKADAEVIEKESPNSCKRSPDKMPSKAGNKICEKRMPLFQAKNQSCKIRDPVNNNKTVQKIDSKILPKDNKTQRPKAYPISHPIFTEECEHFQSQSCKSLPLKKITKKKIVPSTCDCKEESVNMKKEKSAPNKKKPQTVVNNIKDNICCKSERNRRVEKNSAGITQRVSASSELSKEKCSSLSNETEIVINKIARSSFEDDSCENKSCETCINRDSSGDKTLSSSLEKTSSYDEETFYSSSDYIGGKENYNCPSDCTKSLIDSTPSESPNVICISKAIDLSREKILKNSCKQEVCQRAPSPVCEGPIQNLQDRKRSAFDKMMENVSKASVEVDPCGKSNKGELKPLFAEEDCAQTSVDRADLTNSRLDCSPKNLELDDLKPSSQKSLKNQTDSDEVGCEEKLFTEVEECDISNQGSIVLEEQKNITDQKICNKFLKAEAPREDIWREKAKGLMDFLDIDCQSVETLDDDEARLFSFYSDQSLTDTEILLPGESEFRKVNTETHFINANDEMDFAELVPKLAADWESTDGDDCSSVGGGGGRTDEEWSLVVLKGGKREVRKGDWETAERWLREVSEELEECDGWAREASRGLRDAKRNACRNKASTCQAASSSEDVDTCSSSDRHRCSTNIPRDNPFSQCQGSFLTYGKTCKHRRKRNNVVSSCSVLFKKRRQDVIPK